MPSTGSIEGEYFTDSLLVYIEWERDAIYGGMMGKYGFLKSRQMLWRKTKKEFPATSMAGKYLRGG